jgi:NAD(P)-dependent dehydrogenase (short-subunit alcohol dehydrogenase family)
MRTAVGGEPPVTVPDDLRLDGAVALVTGAAGAIGEAITARLRALGATVARADLEFNRSPGATSAGSDHWLDVRSDDACAAVVAEVVDLHGGLDLLVNNAGVMIRQDALATDTAVWQGVLDVNLTGAYRMARAAHAALVRSGDPAIVSVSSTHAFLAARRSIAYSTSKAGLSHLTRLLAVEWAPAIRVNAVAPTVVPSAMTEDVLADPEYVARKFAAIPAGRPVPAADVAAAVSFLAGRSARSITGHVLVLDGGESLL